MLKALLLSLVLICTALPQYNMYYYYNNQASSGGSSGGGTPERENLLANWQDFTVSTRYYVSIGSVTAPFTYIVPSGWAYFGLIARSESGEYPMTAGVTYDIEIIMDSGNDMVLISLDSDTNPTSNQTDIGTLTVGTNTFTHTAAGNQTRLCFQDRGSGGTRVFSKVAMYLH